MQELQVLEKDGVRVLTTKQLAEAYESDVIHIKQNFANNKRRFVEGKHYILLTGEDLKSFKNEVENFDLVAKTVNRTYLWTEKGALLHAKSLNTDKAWEVYDYLVDSYFRSRETLAGRPAELGAQAASPALQQYMDALRQFEDYQRSTMEELVEVCYSMSDRLEALESRKEGLAGITIGPGQKPFTVAEDENAARKKKLNRLVKQLAKACGWTTSFALHRLYKTLEEVLNISIDEYVDLYREEVQGDVCAIDAVAASGNLYSTAIRLCNNTLEKMRVEVQP